MQPDDPYILQQLALATYKFQQPDRKTSLINAKDILNALAPQTSSDAETVGLWGAIHKRLWDEGKDREHLDEAVRAYGRGYYIKTDYYNGINYAFVLDVRASCSEGDEALVGSASRATGPQGRPENLRSSVASDRRCCPTRSKA